jgi:putative ABC transport system substrate-binding protein
VGAAWPLVTRAQQPAAPVIGLLDSRSPEAMGNRLIGFRRGLKETGFVEGDNVSILYRWAENQYDRLPALAADLVRQGISVLATTGGPPAAFAAKAATNTIPIVFLVGQDPVRLDLVTSLARPTENLTGVNLFNAELEPKRLEFLRELVPRAARIAVLISPLEPTNAEITSRELRTAAPAMGLQLQFFNVNTPEEIDAVFASLAREKPDAVFFGTSAFMNGRRVQSVQLATFHRLPAAFSSREAIEIGGLMSYSANIADAFRQVGIYVGRVLKGAKPTDLPVVQATKLELIINARTARMLGLGVPQTLLVAADEVIE